MNEATETTAAIIEYRGAVIAVEVPENVTASLKINGVTRATESGTFPCRLRLSSTVQTDYEWHEFIEAIIDFSENETLVTVNANNSQILIQSLPLADRD